MPFTQHIKYSLLVGFAEGLKGAVLEKPVLSSINTVSKCSISNKYAGGRTTLQEYRYDVLDREFDLPKDKSECSRILTERTRADFRPKKAVRFYFDKTRVLEDIAHNIAPVVVCSSKRSSFIKASLEKSLNLSKNYAFSDISIYEEHQTALFYDPVRTQRPVFICVKEGEYETYRTKLAEIPNVNVVGYSDSETDSSGLNTRYFGGFGYSRYCALIFLKRLMRATNNNIEFVWLSDDNLAHVKNLDSLDSVENMLNFQDGMVAATFDADDRELMDSSFFSDTESINGCFRGRYDVKKLTDLLKRDYNSEDSDFFCSEDKNVAQQLVVWNMKALLDNDFNFSSEFMTCAEDLALTGFCRHVKKYQIKTVNKTKIYKHIKLVMDTEKNDNLKGTNNAILVNNGYFDKEASTKVFADQPEGQQLTNLFDVVRDYTNGAESVNDTDGNIIVYDTAKRGRIINDLSDLQHFIEKSESEFSQESMDIAEYHKTQNLFPFALKTTVDEKNEIIRKEKVEIAVSKAYEKIMYKCIKRPQTIDDTGRAEILRMFGDADQMALEWSLNDVKLSPAAGFMIR